MMMGDDESKYIRVRKFQEPPQDFPNRLPYTCDHIPSLPLASWSAVDGLVSLKLVQGLCDF